MSQDCRGLVKGQVSHEDMGGVREPVVQEVAVDDLDSGVKPLFETTGESPVDLHHGEWSSEVLQAFGQGPGARADLNDRP